MGKCPLCDGAGRCDGGSSEVDDFGMAEHVLQARIGCVRGGGRPNVLRHMPGRAAAAGFTQNHPTCPQCGSPARPAILMFGDWHHKDDDNQEARFDAWNKAVLKEMKEMSEKSTPVKAVILEVGAGKNVPTVRMTSETQLEKWLKISGADASLI